MAVLILVVFVTLLISAQCSLFEATLYSTRIATLEAARTRDKRRFLAERFLQMKRNISEPISAILILNTLANTAGAVIAGVYAAQVLGGPMVPVFSALFTLAILFLAEILPKTLGAVYWRTLWPIIVRPLSMIQTGLHPFVLVTERFSRMFTKGHAAPAVTEEDILGMTRLGANTGEITELESLMVHNIIELENKTVEEIMTPRTVIYALDAATTVEEALTAISERGFSRIPVYEKGEKEQIVGYVNVKDLIAADIGKKEETRIAALAKEITFVEETANCLTLLTTFLKHRRHIAIVADEYGGVAGLVTLEDLIETVLGTEIVDETDRVVDLQKSARERGKRLTPEGKKN